MPVDVNTLGPPPIRTPLLGADGVMTPAWAQFFNAVYQRVGAGYTTPLNSTNDSVASLANGLAAAKGLIAAAQAAIAAANAQIAALEADVAAQGGEIAGIQAELGAGIAATIVTAKLTMGGTEGSMTFTSSGILSAQTPAT